MDAKEIGERLAEPFPANAVSWKPQSVKGNRALAIAYIDARDVQDRLDQVVGVAGWQDEYQLLPDGGVVCQLRVEIGGQWVVKTDVGSPSEQPDGGDRMKAAFSDALKRAAVKFGVGRYLYGLPHQWVDYDPVKKQFVRTPQMPACALPKRADGSPRAALAAGPTPDDAGPRAELAARFGRARDWKEKLAVARDVYVAIQDRRLSDGDKVALQGLYQQADAAHPTPPGYAALTAACKAAGVSPRRALERHAQQVGAFPEGKPLPAPEDLTPAQWDHLAAAVRQSAQPAAREPGEEG